jgi:HlyD family secretion protein
LRIAPILSAVVLAAAAAGGYVYWLDMRDRIPAGFARSNGRVEIERVDIAAKYSGRLSEVTVNEGSDVRRGQVLARFDTTETIAQLAAAKASVHRSHQSVASAEAGVSVREAERNLAQIELDRVIRLVRTSAAPQAELDRQKAQRETSIAALESAKAMVEDARASVEVAEAQVRQIEAVLADMTLQAPVSGRVEYRLARGGEIVAGGQRVLTLFDLSDVYMTVFLSTADSGRVAIGSEARIILDGAPESVVPATVSFVSAEAQFTPKYVETADEREKLMYRVKLRIDPQLLESDRVFLKAGMTGDAYIRVATDAVWPAILAQGLPDVR